MSHNCDKKDYCTCGCETNLFNFPNIRETWLPTQYIFSSCDCHMFQKAKNLCLSDHSFSFSKEEVRDELESFLSQSSKKDSSFVPANDAKKSPFSESMRLISLSLSNRPGVREDFEKIIETFSKKVESDNPPIVCHSDFCSHCKLLHNSKLKRANAF